MAQFVKWFSGTPFSQYLAGQAPWAWPLAETLHFAGLGLLIGTVGLVDLRLLGVVRGVPLSAVREFIRWSIVGFGINLVTGLYFLGAQPWQYADNPAWWAKVAFLIVAGLNAAIFEKYLRPRLRALPPDADTPLSLKLVGAASLISWFGVLYSGRMLAFVVPN